MFHLNSKKMKNFYLIFIFFIYNQSLVYSQSEYRYNEFYTTTELFDDFTNNLNPNTWVATTHLIKGLSGNPFIYVDSTITINVDANNSRLCLSMISSPNYTTTDWDGNPITADYIVGEINSEEFYSYGIFECNAKFAHDFGSFPAFWLYGGGGVDCSTDHINEIDIVECRVHSFHGTPLPKLQNHIFDYPPPCGNAVGYEFTETQGINWDVNHTFKCIWSPYRITFWIDDTLLKEVVYQGQSWYPNHHMRVILSQQVQSGTLVVPQTSYFNWVKVRSFFLAPEITVPNLICSSGTATLDVDSKASNITWTLSPSGLFTGATSGSGKIVSINAGSAIGEGKITYSFEMPGGETFEAEETFWVGKPSLDVSSEFFKIISADGGSDYVCTDQAGNEFDLSYFNNKCGCTNYEIKLTGLNGITVYDQFYTSGNGDLDYPYLSEGWYIIWARGYNACGWGDWVSTELEFRDCSQMLLLFTPNPTTGETTMSIESTSKEKTFDENTTWDFEVYSETQLLKKKQTNLRGQSTKIQTNGWKEGVYSVRVKYQNEILTGKLVVKR